MSYNEYTGQFLSEKKKHTCAISKKNIAEAESELIAYHLGRNQILKPCMFNSSLRFSSWKKKQKRCFHQPLQHPTTLGSYASNFPRKQAQRSGVFFLIQGISWVLQSSLCVLSCFLVLKFYFKESLFSKKILTEIRSPKSRTIRHFQIQGNFHANFEKKETNEALQFPSWWGHSHHLDYHPKSWDPPTSKRASHGGHA